MQISIQCPHCSARLRAKEKHIGRKVPCPNCGRTFIVSAADGQTEAQRADTVADQVAATDGSPANDQSSTAELRSFANSHDPFGIENFEANELFAAQIGEPTSPEADPLLASHIPQTAAASPFVRRDQSTDKGTSPRKIPAFAIASIAGIGGLAVLLCLLIGVGIWLFGTADAETPNAVAVNAPNHSPDAVAANGTIATAARDADSNAPDDLKAATVFIQVKSADRFAEGAGVLIHKDGKAGLILTTTRLVPPTRHQWINCIFKSDGPGAFSADAKLEGADEHGEVAVLRVEHALLPNPIRWKGDVELNEKLPIQILGLGKPSSESASKLPPTAVSKSSIKSVRRDEDNHIVAFVGEHEISPQSTGGAVVTEDGRLIGIAVAGDEEAGSGFVIGKWRLMQSLAGRVTGMTLGTIENSAARHRYRIIMNLLDPFENVVSATVLTCPAEQLTDDEPSSDGSWKRVRDDMAADSCRIFRRPADTTATVDFNTPPAKTLVQIMLTRKDGTMWYGRPRVLQPAA